MGLHAARRGGQARVAGVRTYPGVSRALPFGSGHRHYGQRRQDDHHDDRARVAQPRRHRLRRRRQHRPRTTGPASRDLRANHRRRRAVTHPTLAHDPQPAGRRDHQHHAEPSRSVRLGRLPIIEVPDRRVPGSHRSGRAAVRRAARGTRVPDDARRHCLVRRRRADLPRRSAHCDREPRPHHARRPARPGCPPI